MTGRLSYSVNPVNPCFLNYGFLEGKTYLNYPVDFSTHNMLPKSFPEQLLFDRNTYNACKTAIESFSLYKENWDGYGALSIDPQTKKNALDFLLKLNLFTNKVALSFPELTPNTNGTINFEWEEHDKIANLDIGKTRLSFFITRPGYAPIIYDGETNALCYGKVFGLILDAFFSPVNYSNTISSITYSHVCNPA